MRIPALLIVGMSLLLPSSSAAQRQTLSVFPSHEAAWTPSSDLRAARVSRADVDDTTDEGDLVIGSLMGGIGTFWLTAYLASQLHGTPCEDCGLEEGLYGAAIGFGLGSAIGAHLANHGEGPLGKSALIGMAIGTVGSFAAIESNRWEVLLAIPVAQIISAVAIVHGHGDE